MNVFITSLQLFVLVMHGFGSAFKRPEKGSGNLDGRMNGWVKNYDEDENEDEREMRILGKVTTFSIQGEKY